MSAERFGGRATTDVPGPRACQGVSVFLVLEVTGASGVPGGVTESRGWHEKASFRSSPVSPQHPLARRQEEKAPRQVITINKKVE